MTDRDPPPRRLDSVLAAGDLARLRDGARRRAECERVLRTLLDPPLADRVRVGGIEPDALVVVADGPAWAARLRFVPAGVVEALRERLAWPGLRRIRVVARPAPADAPAGAEAPGSSQAPALSQRARDALREAAESTDNPALREALDRLARSRRS